MKYESKETKYKYICPNCGMEVYTTELQEDFDCPFCGHVCTTPPTFAVIAVIAILTLLAVSFIIA